MADAQETTPDANADKWLHRLINTKDSSEFVRLLDESVNDGWEIVSFQVTPVDGSSKVHFTALLRSYGTPQPPPRLTEEDKELFRKLNANRPMSLSEQLKKYW